MEKSNQIKEHFAQQGIDPVLIFDRYLLAELPSVRDSTIRNYQTLWLRFLGWLIEVHLTIPKVRDQDIHAFFSGLKDINRQQRERYQLVIKRGFEAVQSNYKNLANPLQTKGLQDIHAEDWRSGQSNRSKQFLSIEQSSALIQQLNASFTIAQQESQKLGLTPNVWKLIRDHTLVALALGSGLKVLELLSLRPEAIQFDTNTVLIDCGCLIDFDPKVQHDVNRTTPNESIIQAYIHDQQGQHRHVRLMDWAIDWLQLWLSVRFDTTVLFPSRRIIKSGQKSVMNPATLARIVQAWGLEHGFKGLTAQRLRNTYGALRLEDGATLDTLNAEMGYVSHAAGAFKLAQEWQHFKASHALEKLEDQDKPNIA